MSTSSTAHHIVLLGDSCVGKGSICHRLLYDTFKEQTDVLPQEAAYIVPISKILGVNDAPWKQTLQIDKMSADPSLATATTHMHDFWASVAAVVVVVSLQRESTLASIGKWKEYLGKCRGTEEKVIPVVVVATGLDLLAETTSTESAAALSRNAAAEFQWPFYEVSCKTGEGVFEVFEEMILGLEPLRRFENDEPLPPSYAFASQHNSNRVAAPQRLRSNARLPILVSPSSPDSGSFTPDGCIHPLRSAITEANLGIGPLRPGKGKQETLEAHDSDSLSDHSDHSSPRQLSPRSDHSDDSYLSPHRKVLSVSTDSPNDRTNRRALFTRSVTLTPGQKGSGLSRSDARRSLILNQQASSGSSSSLSPDSLSPTRKSNSKLDTSPLRSDLRSSERTQKLSSKYDVSTMRLMDRPTKVPTKIDFQKEASFDGKRRLIIISGDHLFIYKNTEGHKKLIETLEITSASTKRPKASELKVLLVLSSGVVRRVKFSDEGTLALFRGKIQEHSKAKAVSQGPLVSPKFSEVFVNGKDALALLYTNMENHYCADCGEMDPTFASTNFTVLLCAGCAKWHQQLPNTVSRVVRIETECWNPYLLEMLMWMSNLVANMIWEERLLNNEEECRLMGLPSKPLNVSSDAEKKAFIEAKYGKRAFLEPNYLASMLNMDDDLPNRALNVALKISTLTPKHFPALVKFISHQISPDSVVDSQPLLLTACASGNCIAAIYLLENGADPNLKDALGTRPIDHTERFDAEVIATLLPEFKTSLNILMIRSTSSLDQSGSIQPESTSIAIEWPKASSTILSNYGADARTSIVPPLIMNKSESGEWGSLRASANSIKAAQLLGLMEAPNRNSLSSPGRGPGSELASSFSPRSTMFGVSSSLSSSYSSSSYGAGPPSSNSPSPRSPHSSVLPNSRLSRTGGTNPAAPSSPSSARNTVHHLSDDYLQSHQLNNPPSPPKSAEPTTSGGWTVASPPSPSSPLQTGHSSLSDTARHRVLLSSANWKTTKQGLGNELRKELKTSGSIFSGSSASIGSTASSEASSINDTSDSLQSPLELAFHHGFSDSLDFLPDPTLISFDDVPNTSDGNKSWIDLISGDLEISLEVPKADEAASRKPSWETIQSAPASSNPLQQ